MAFDPAAIGESIGTIILAVGAALGAPKVIGKFKPQEDAAPKPPYCAEHYRCFEELKDMIGEVKEDVAYLRGKADGR